jgi:hypothetical protein
MIDPDVPDDDPPARPWWRGPVVWGLVLSIALVAYELTAQPALAVVTVSLKMGWGRFATAVWLRRRDPNRARGRACFWLYLASGFAVAALTGFALLLAFPFFLPKQANGPAAGANPAPNPVLSAFTGATIAWLLGMVLASVALLIALVLARRHHIRLWLHGDVGLARERGEWPPTYGRTNQAAFPILIALLLAWALFFGVLATLVSVMAEEFGLRIPKQVGVPSIMVVTLIGLPLSTLVVWDYVKKNLLAGMPGECWNDRAPIDPDPADDL